MTDPKHPDPHKPAAPKAAHEKPSETKATTKATTKPHAHPAEHPPEKVVERVIVEREPEPAPVPAKGLLVGGAAVALITSAVMGVFRGARGLRGRGWGRRR